MTRAAIVSDRLWREGRRSWTTLLNDAIAGGTTLLELIERRIQEWEGHLKNQGAIPQLRDETETTEVVIDLNLERYLREALRSKMFMRHSDIDDVFAFARELAQKGERR
jgi:hypothetical protein